MSEAREGTGAGPVLELRGAGFSYGSRAVLEGVSLAVSEGDAVGLVGESGAGKSTILALMLGLSSPRAGEVRFDGAPLDRRDRRLMRRFRASVQPVFQDPYSSLDPRQRIDRIVTEPLQSLGLARSDDARERAVEAVTSVGLDADVLTRYPHEFSGGQRQRIAIARAIVSRPRVLLADEPVSALDVTTRVQVIDLLARLRREQGLALVMVSHDLGAVAAVCDHTVVLQGGRVVEQGPTRRILSHPDTDYARALVAAVPRLPR
ncbi:ATP-binding cassette domain-containing protein [Microbacterium sp. cx-55]|uniref:ABC transporter ATP-binding protein n=1 Tax=Microbacterium sp. cx-55 TaxID=2875948 RepID=UPI001CBE9356|nr:ATP-binding cassette domain-containing protein [Microbacterium sp. cx-55]MBZ4487245.1 ATP-binding cassette domain-containing protein [Microbacterium sp. cx-55]UGB35268.1 ATP-binding cassette domain-containing protein [Microbacterium sp. cx-55]